MSVARFNVGDRVVTEFAEIVVRGTITGFDNASLYVVIRSDEEVEIGRPIDRVHSLVLGELDE